MTTVSTFEYKLMGALLFLLAAMSAAIGALCVVNYMNGHTLRAASALILPAFLLSWAWQDGRNNSEIIGWFGVAWFAGLLLGLLAGVLRLLIG